MSKKVIMILGGKSVTIDTLVHSHDEKKCQSKKLTTTFFFKKWKSCHLHHIFFSLKMSFRSKMVHSGRNFDPIFLLGKSFQSLGSNFKMSLGWKFLKFFALIFLEFTHGAMMILMMMRRWWYSKLPGGKNPTIYFHCKMDLKSNHIWNKNPIDLLNWCSSIEQWTSF